MRFVFKFPDIGEGIMEGRILQWYVKKGQAVKSGEPLVNVETDKVVTDIPSPKDGTIAALFGKEGELINVEDPLVELDIEGVIGEEAQNIVQEKPKPASEEVVEEKGFGVVGTIDVAGDSAFLPATHEGLEVQVQKSTPKKKKSLATPVARNMARDLGIDINDVTGTGPAGRVMKEDIQQYSRAISVARIPAAVPMEDLVEYADLSQIRKTIARNMIRSKQNAAHMSVLEEVEVSELVDIRSRYKDTYIEQGFKLTYLPFFIKAVVEALKEFPVLNAELDMEKGQIAYKKYYNIGIAVDTDDGLVVPVIKQADRLSIVELSRRIDELAQKARDRKLDISDFKDGTFTLTNYGSIGGVFGVPVINYPQVGIMGFGRLQRKPVVKDDDIGIGHILPISLSVDHRIVDGGDAARFVTRVMSYLKDPLTLLMS